MTTKHCPKCGRDLPTTEFHRDKSRPSGLYSYCKECNYRSSRRYREQKPEYYAEYNRQYRSDHLDELREYSRQYSKKRYANNKGLWVEYVRTRRARKRANGVHLTLSAWKKRLASLGEECVYCGAQYESIDHIIPVSRGGNDSPENLAPACLACNLGKRNTPVLEWFARHPSCNDERLSRISNLYLSALKAQETD